MNDLQKIVRSASIAAWLTALVGGIWLTVGWLIWLGILNAQPDWLLRLWGGGELTWATVHSLVLWFIAVAKMILYVFVLSALCLTFWQRGLKKCCQ